LREIFRREIWLCCTLETWASQTQAAQHLRDLAPLLNQQKYTQFVCHGYHDSSGALSCGGGTQLLLDLQLDLSRKLQCQMGMQQRKELVMKLRQQLVMQLRQQLLRKMGWQVLGQVADARQLG